MSVILAVDPGEVRIGLAICDSTGTIARPMQVLRHTARAQDAERIVKIAGEYQAEVILVGLALDADGEAGYQACRALRLVDAIKSITRIQVVTSDESWTTLAASRSTRKKRGKDPDLDARAAAYLLQEYLDAANEKP
jgi:putative holliday junction resolvase